MFRPTFAFGRPGHVLALGLLLAPGIVSAQQASGGGTSSALWGERGERWSPASRLPDFSYAGYHRGERPLPTRAPDVSVMDYGAVGDGKADDTAAFRRAIEVNPGEVIAVPAGQYRITNILTISASGTVLQGDGPDRSVLVVPVPLERIKPNRGATTDGSPTSNYSWSGGIIQAIGSLEGKRLTAVRGAAKRGDVDLTVESTAALRVGLDVRLTQQDDGGRTLTSHLYAGDTGPISKIGRVRATFVARIAAVDAAQRTIRLDRPLRTDVRPEWSPQVQDARGTVEEVGIEGLAFTFPVTPYGGHFTELGYNPIAFRGIRNGYLRNLAFRNADSGPFLGGENLTVTGIVHESSRPPDARSRCTGHHGLTLGGTDMLLHDFQIKARFIHDITVTRGSAGNVTMSGTGTDLALDHHRMASHANLWTDLDAGAGTRLYASGGGSDLGWHGGAWETFWNIRAARPLSWPGAGRREKWGPDLMNLVGLTTNERSTLDPDGRWFEAIPPAALVPANLYRAQLARRLGRAAGSGESAR
jgi:hypothetical protein